MSTSRYFVTGFFLLFLIVPQRVFTQDLDKFSLKNPVTVSGKLSSTATFYSSSGESQRDPFYWLINGSVNISYNGVSIPLSFTFSQQQRAFAQPFNQIGMSPSYKGVTLHLGYRSMNFSDITLGGATFLGVGAEVKPKNSRMSYAAMYGQLVQPIAPGNLTDSFTETPAYARYGYGAKITHENDGNTVDFIFFRGSDDVSSVDIPDSLDVDPQENAIVGLNFKRTFNKKLTLNLQTAYSGYTLNTRLAPATGEDFSYRNNLDPFLETNLSTQFNKAIITDLTYKAKLFNVKFAYRRIDPEYQTMGSTFLVNDFENITGTVSWVMLKNKLNFSATYGQQRDNLNADKVSEMQRDVGGINAVYVPNPKLNFSASYSNFSSSTTYDAALFLDSLNYLQVTRNGTLNVNYLINKKNKNRAAYLLANWQDVSDPSGNSSTFYNFSVGHQMFYTISGVTLNTGLTYTNNAVTGLINDSYGPTISVSKNFFEKKLNARFNTTALQSNMDGERQSRFINTRLNFKYIYNSKHQLQFAGTYLVKQSFGDTDDTTTEFRGQFGYSYKF
ncbi:MAG: hypothetical protein AAGF85_14575 [Bacteroidota bacterium]